LRTGTKLRLHNYNRRKIGNTSSFHNRSISPVRVLLLEITRPAQGLSSLYFLGSTSGAQGRFRSKGFACCHRKPRFGDGKASSL
jgi:hypothetical protein